MDIETDGLHLAVLRGFLTVSKNGEELGRIALDDIGALIVHAHGVTYSNTVFARLAERKVPVVLCGSNHMPFSIVWPLDGFYAQGARMQAQLAASKPLQKQLWAQVVTGKIRMQQRVLESCGKGAAAFDLLVRKVRSGDPENVEAQAARRYWQELFGPHFRRDQNGDGLNILLNYGYTVLRALVARSICASGLHPTLGIFHSNRQNAFALADDLMEPFRPLVDRVVINLKNAGFTKLDSQTKLALTSLSSFDLAGLDGVSPLFKHVQRLAYSVATSFENGKALALLPQLPEISELALLGVKQESEDDSLS